VKFRLIICRIHANKSFIVRKCVFLTKSRNLVPRNFYKNPFIVKPSLRLSMGSISKSFSLVLIVLLAVSSLMMAKPAFAQTPPTPVFNVSTITGSYTVPTTYSTNPYTGAKVTTQGYTVTYFNITFTIQNPPFFTVQNPPITSSYMSYYYVLEYKGHYTSQWTPLVEVDSNITIFASSGSQTVLTLSGNPSSNSITLQYVNAPYPNADSGLIIVPLGGKVDFRLQAVSSNGAFIPNYSYLVQGNVSAFSAVQTVTIPNNFTSTSASPSPTSTSTPTPTVPEFPTWIILPLFAVIILLSTVFFRKRIPKKIAS